METHLDPISLDAARAGEANEAIAAHLEECARCRDEVERLRSMAEHMRSPVTDVPAELEGAILSLASRRLRLRRLRPVVAVAASLLLALGLAFLVGTRGGPAGDVDRSGSLDIVDSYLLALRLERGDELDSQWDVNSDGRVDLADVRYIARRSVALGEPR
jgi:predicted anti-sigma-YlaC factor YlaD